MPEPEKVNVLLMGGGGREHAIAAALTRSSQLGRLWLTDSRNPGLGALGIPVDVPVSVRESYRLVQFCDKHAIGLVVIGPEEPLAEGWADKLRSPTRLVFGPGADGARLEADKAWAKQLMRSASIPTADSRVFGDAESAVAYIKSRPQMPVIKASGLAKGKGVFVPDTLAQATAAIEQIMVKRAFGDAGREVVVEERLAGPEVSILALVDGSSIYVLETAQDHKRLRDADEGPNTGGMGAFSPSRLVDDDMMARIEREVLVPTLDALRREGIEYRGVLYAGLMLTHAGPKVLEFNVRFGDPECQAILARLDSDLIDVMLATCRGRLDTIELRWRTGASCCVVIASDGYPESPRTGAAISGLDEAGRVEGVTVFHSGTAAGPGGEVITAGGRVLSVTAVADDLGRARDRAYEACGRISFPGMHFRRDIGAPPAAARQRFSNASAARTASTSSGAV